MGFLDAILGGSSQKSESTQTQDSFGFGLNRGSSSSVSGGSSTGRSGGMSGSSSSVFAGDLVRQLLSGSLDAAGALNPGLATERVNQLFTGGASILDRISGGGAGEDYLERRLADDGGEVLNAQIDSLGGDLGRFFKDELNPVITGNAVSAGQLGGGRQGVAQAGATSSILREFATQAAGLRAADVANRDSAALGLMDRQNQGSAVALGSLPSLASVGSGSAALDPFRALGEIFGSPTVLSESFGQEFSEQQAQEFASSLAEELGISYDEAHALLKSKSKGSSSGGLLPAISGLMGAG